MSQSDRTEMAMEKIRQLLASMEILARECAYKDGRERADIARDHLNKAYAHLAEVYHQERLFESRPRKCGFLGKCVTGYTETCATYDGCAWGWIEPLCNIYLPQEVRPLTVSEPCSA